MTQRFQTLPGFRDFYPEDCAVRNYLFGRWRDVARRYGFTEYEGPMLEATDLYRRKSGEEIVHQLFHFTDRGEREVALRPELTPTLARMAAARQRDYRKPLRWFSIGRFFRYEKQQKGRLREFYQFNCDILGEASPSADAELVALAIELMGDLGFRSDDFRIRLSDREAWTEFASGEKLAPDAFEAFLRVVDKLERDPEDRLDKALRETGTSLDAVRRFIEEGTGSKALQLMKADLEARGLGGYLDIDLSIVRGLAYYTGPVFEVFDQGKNMRAVAGGGRYDSLVDLIGAADMPATGFAMGDVVIANLIAETEHTRLRQEQALAAEGGLDLFVVVADEARRPEALGLLQRLRSAGFRTAHPLVQTKVGKQFQAAEQQGARYALVVGVEYPDLTLKELATREERNCRADGLESELSDLLRRA